VSLSEYCTAAKTSDGSFVVAYMPTQRTITVNMSRLKGPAMASWFDPTSGKFQTIAGGTLQNSGLHQFAPPGKNRDGDGDWVLVLNASGHSGSGKGH